MASLHPESLRGKEALRLPGFEPGWSARKAEMIDQTTPQPPKCKGNDGINIFKTDKCGDLAFGRDV